MDLPGGRTDRIVRDNICQELAHNARSVAHLRELYPDDDLASDRVRNLTLTLSED
jgi:hypothetical protein